MSDEQLDAQHESITKMAKEIQAFKRWLPLVAAAGAVIGFIIKLSFSAAQYDDNLVKKDKLPEILKGISTISVKQDRRTVRDSLHHVADSIALIAVKNQLAIDREYNRQQFQALRNEIRKIKPMVLSGENYHYENGKRIVTLATN